MRRKYLLLALFFLLLPFGPLRAEDNMSVSLDVEKGKVDLGDSFQIIMVIKNASTQGANLDGIEIPGLNNFQVLGNSDSTRIQIANGASLMVSENRRTLKATKTGDFQLGPIVLKTTDAQGTVIEVKSGIQTVKVVPAGVKPLFSTQAEDTVFGSKDKAAKTNGIEFWGLLKNLFMLGLLVLFVYLFRKRQRGTGFDYDPEPVSKKILVEIPDSKSENYWSVLKENILNFLQEKYGFNTSALTSSEILGLLKKKDPRAFLIVEMALKICDQGRFLNSLEEREEIRVWVDKLNGL